MRFVPLNEGQMYPAASPSGDQGDLLDTGWDVLWPGPARVYLSAGDLRDLVCADGFLDVPLVVEALTLRGWTAPSELAAHVVEFESQLARLEEDLASARAEADGLVLALRRAEPDDIVDRELAAVGANDEEEGD